MHVLLRRIFCLFRYKANKANLLISAFFLQAAKWILMPLNATPHISQVVVFLTTVTVSSTSLWDSTKGSSSKSWSTSESYSTPDDSPDTPNYSSVSSNPSTYFFFGIKKITLKFINDIT